MADFNIQVGNFNTTFPIETSFAQGDDNLDGRIDLTDFLRFRLAFEGQAAGAATAPVPEPAAGLMAVLLGISMLQTRRRRLA